MTVKDLIQKILLEATDLNGDVYISSNEDEWKIFDISNYRDTNTIGIYIKKKTRSIPWPCCFKRD